MSFVRLQRANTVVISNKILEVLSHPSIFLTYVRYVINHNDGASVMSSDKEGVQAKIKEVSPMALYTHCYSHCLNLFIAASCEVQEVKNLIGVMRSP